MSKEIVKYKNDMNKLNFKGLGKSDMNLFLAICSKVKEQGENVISIDFDYLRQISHYTGHTIDGFINDLRRMSQRIMAVNCEIIMDNGGFNIFNLFQQFIADPETQILTVKINSDFTWLLNEFTNNYTTFELQEFVGLQSKYAKNLYRLLKQWRTVGQYTFNDINQFRDKMDVPEAYSNMRLWEKVITPAIKELRGLDKSFINFKCEPLYAKRRGKPLTGFKFSWQPEQLQKTAPEEIPVTISKLVNPKNVISPEEKDKLVNEFGKATVEDYIQRTTQYKCCNYATIRKWILEDQEKQSTRQRSNNQFFQFNQREVSKEELDELEKKLLCNGLHPVDETESSFIKE